MSSVTVESSLLALCLSLVKGGSTGLSLGGTDKIGPSRTCLVVGMPGRSRKESKHRHHIRRKVL